MSESAFPGAVDVLVVDNTDLTDATTGIPRTGPVGHHASLHNQAAAAILATQEALRPFDHVQAAPAATWTIDHGLGRPVTSVMVIDNSGVELVGAREFPTSDRVIVRFTTAISGRARVA